MALTVAWTPGRTTDLIVRVFGGDPKADKEQIEPEELPGLLPGAAASNPEQRTIITGALEIHERILREVLD